MPTRTEKQITLSQVCPSPAPANLVASFKLPANEALMTNRKKRKKHEIMVGIASFRKFHIIWQIESCLLAVNTIYAALSFEYW